MDWLFEKLGIARAEDARAARTLALVGMGVGVGALGLGIAGAISAGSACEAVFGKEGSSSEPKSDGLLLRVKAQGETITKVEARASTLEKGLVEAQASIGNKLDALAAARAADKADLGKLVDAVKELAAAASAHPAPAPAAHPAPKAATPAHTAPVAVVDMGALVPAAPAAGIT